MSSRSGRRVIANETVEICNRGRYTNRLGEVVHLKRDIESAVERTIHYPSSNSEELLELRDARLKEHRFAATEFVLRNCTTLEAASDLSASDTSGHIVCLNFASAKNPGGGFLNGSQAQEESLARASALHSCIFPCMEHYEEGRNCGDCYYTDTILYSPDVPVFRNDDDELLDQPYAVSFITSPAVNAGAVTRTEQKPASRIESVMLARTEKVLSVAIINQGETLVLGAWGCGVFKNDPVKVASWFRYLLVDNQHFAGAFKKVYFAVLDRTSDQHIFKAFQEEFGSLTERHAG